MTREIDYRRAFKIACELLNGSVLYGIDADKIYEIMAAKEGVVSSDSYESYILNNLQELDRGQYASEPTTKNNLGVDKEQLKTMIRGLTKWYVKRDNTEVGEPNTAVGLLYDDVMFGIDRLPSVTPQEPKAEDCISREKAIASIKWWFDILKQNPDILIDSIKTLPSVYPKSDKPSGKWEHITYYDGGFGMNETCSNCGHTIHGQIFDLVDKYCPNCGARMVEPQESED